MCGAGMASAPQHVAKPLLSVAGSPRNSHFAHFAPRCPSAAYDASGASRSDSNLAAAASTSSWRRATCADMSTSVIRSSAASWSGDPTYVAVSMRVVPSAAVRRSIAKSDGILSIVAVLLVSTSTRYGWTTTPGNSFSSSSTWNVTSSTFSTQSLRMANGDLTPHNAPALPPANNAACFAPSKLFDFTSSSRMTFPFLTRMSARACWRPTTSVASNSTTSSRCRYSVVRAQAARGSRLYSGCMPYGYLALASASTM